MVIFSPATTLELPLLSFNLTKETKSYINLDYKSGTTNSENCWIYHKELYSEEFLNQEIEIEAKEKIFQISSALGKSFKEILEEMKNDYFKRNIIIKAQVKQIARIIKIQILLSKIKELIIKK
mgnify:CR=1 FL=1